MKVMKEILGLRGYTVGEEDDNELSFTKPAAEKGGIGKKGKVVFIKRDKANVDDLAEIFRAVVKDPIHVIVVYKVMTNPAINSFKNDISKYFEAELIPMSKLIRNPLTHRLTPTTYKKLSLEEKKDVLKKYKVIKKDANPNEPVMSDQELEKKFPAMAPTDINAILFGFREGDLIEIESHYNFTTKKVDMEMPAQITYRIVRYES